MPAGIDDGATIRLKERGEAMANGPKGDLYVHIRVKAHKHFTREGDLILSEEHVGMVDAALGTEITVDTVDGKIKWKFQPVRWDWFQVKWPRRTASSQRDRRGAHIVSIIVDTPTAKKTKRAAWTVRRRKKAKSVLNKSEENRYFIKRSQYLQASRFRALEKPVLPLLYAQKTAKNILPSNTRAVTRGQRLRHLFLPV